MANRMLARARKSSFAADIAAAVSEAAGFAAWLHADMGDIGTARSYYRMAIDRARVAGQNLLAGYMLGSLAGFETDGSDPGLAFRLASEALGIGINYSSERVIEKARHFRRSYTGPASAYVQNFDEQLRSTIL
jgi:hypothetical protein